MSLGHDGFPGVYICQNLSSCTTAICAVYFMSFRLLIKLFKKEIFEQDRPIWKEKRKIVYCLYLQVTSENEDFKDQVFILAQYMHTHTHTRYMRSLCEVHKIILNLSIFKSLKTYFL